MFLRNGWDTKSIDGLSFSPEEVIYSGITDEYTEPSNWLEILARVDQNADYPRLYLLELVHIVADQFDNILVRDLSNQESPIDGELSMLGYVVKFLIENPNIGFVLDYPPIKRSLGLHVVGLLASQADSELRTYELSVIANNQRIISYLPDPIRNHLRKLVASQGEIGPLTSKEKLEITQTIESSYEREEFDWERELHKLDSEEASND